MESHHERDYIVHNMKAVLKVIHGKPCLLVQVMGSGQWVGEGKKRRDFNELTRIKRPCDLTSHEGFRLSAFVINLQKSMNFTE